MALKHDKGCYQKQHPNYACEWNCECPCHLAAVYTTVGLSRYIVVAQASLNRYQRALAFKLEAEQK